MSEEVAASIGDVLAENARLRKENMQLKQDVVTWRMIVSRQERALECAHALIRALNIDLLGWIARASLLERAVRRLVAAWRAERQRNQVLEDALIGLLTEPYGCPMCDSGTLRKGTKGHWPDCPYEIARATLGIVE